MSEWNSPNWLEGEDDAQDDDGCFPITCLLLALAGSLL